MPILDREVDVFPCDLLSREDFEPAEQAVWWAVYTRSRQEKELMRALHAMQIPFYCPIVPHRNRSPSGRIRTSHLPLFSNYVFMCGDGHDRYRALQTNLISSTLEVPNSAELLQDLRQIHRLIELGAPLTVEARLQPGTRVRIKNGPLEGILGVILKREGNSFIQVAVNFLQQGASVRLEDFQVEQIG
jgi:transcriptional antiterminator RfaH